ncbi:hypothetical protein [Nocardiopsis sp. NPDC057823]|uniref:hypothetical protein n=1 Tax=Nocardiopsis sp. NPDC057823 TaxID=3346256 RepID=UPI00366F3CEE
MVIGNRAQRAGLTVVCLLLWGVLALGSMAGEFREDPGGLLFVSAIIGSALWLNLKIGFWRRLELHEGHIVLYDYVTRTVVPIGLVQGVAVADGQLSLELSDGRSLPSAAFEGSLWATLFGSRSAARAERLINDFYGFGKGRRTSKGDPGEPCRSPHLNLLALPVVIGTVFVSYYLIGLVFSP